MIHIHQALILENFSSTRLLVLDNTAGKITITCAKTTQHFYARGMIIEYTQQYTYPYSYHAHSIDIVYSPEYADIYMQNFFHCLYMLCRYGTPFDKPAATIYQLIASIIYNTDKYNKHICLYYLVYITILLGITPASLYTYPKYFLLLISRWSLSMVNTMQSLTNQNIYTISTQWISDCLEHVAPHKKFDTSLFFRDTL
jgi:hypothetical protein